MSRNARRPETQQVDDSSQVAYWKAEAHRAFKMRDEAKRLLRDASITEDIPIEDLSGRGSEKYHELFCDIEKQNMIIARMDVPADVISIFRSFGKSVFEEAPKYDMVHYGLFGRLWTADVYLNNSITVSPVLAAGDFIAKSSMESKPALRIYRVRVPSSPRAWHDPADLTTYELPPKQRLFRKGDIVRVLGRDAWDAMLASIPSHVSTPQYLESLYRYDPEHPLAPDGWDLERAAEEGMTYSVSSDQVSEGDAVKLVNRNLKWPASCLKLIREEATNAK